MKILLNKEQVDYIFKIKGEIYNPEKRYISIEFRKTPISRRINGFMKTIYVDSFLLKSKNGGTLYVYEEDKLYKPLYDFYITYMREIKLNQIGI